MLARKRGALRDKSRKMAKKGAPAALQTEVTNDEEWEKILERKGLVFDIYSEWSGPCTGMVSILKRIKMEIGGDHLSYAVAKCDTISSLARFRGKSEPTWMFIRDGKMINLMFGAHCPQLIEEITKELQRLRNNQPPEFSLPVNEVGPKEAERTKAIEEEKKAKEAARMAKIEAKAKAKYEASLSHYTSALKYETCLVLFPWVFRDEEGNKRDKRSSPAYAELIEQLLPLHFSVEQEQMKDLDDDILETMNKECEYVLCEETQNLLLDGKSLCMRLKLKDITEEIDIDMTLIELLYGAPEIPDTFDELLEGCFVQRHLPQMPENYKEVESVEGSPDNQILLTTIWVPWNIRNRVLVFRSLFPKYVDATYPYEAMADDAPIMVFKYDTTKREELQEVLDLYTNEVVNFGVFERDKLPEPKLIAKNLQQFDEIEEKSSYEVFVCVIKKPNTEAFLSFAGIGPYHVSENPDIAIEESDQYFPPPPLSIDDEEEGQSEEEEKLEDEVAT